MRSRKKRPAETIGGIEKAAYLLGVFCRKVASSVESLPTLFTREQEDSRSEYADEHGSDYRRSTGFKRIRNLARSSNQRRMERRAPVDRTRAGDGTGELARALADPDPLVRALALETVGDFTGDRAGRLLAAVLHDSDPRVRCAAAAAAARAGASGAVFSLILSLDDDNRDVRLASARAIQQITGKEIDDHRLNDSESRIEALDELKAWWKQRRFAELATTDGPDFD